MAGVEGKPSPVKKYFEPGAEIHWGRIARDADIAEIAGAVARWNVHATAERQGKVREVPANPDSLSMTFRGGPIAARMVIAKLDMIMNVVADSLNSSPTAEDTSEQRPGEIGKFLSIAVAAAEKERQRLIG